MKRRYDILFLLTKAIFITLSWIILNIFSYLLLEWLDPLNLNSLTAEPFTKILYAVLSVSLGTTLTATITYLIFSEKKHS